MIEDKFTNLAILVSEPYGKPDPDFVKQLAQTFRDIDRQAREAENEACAKVADFGAGNLEIYQGPGNLNRAEHQFAGKQVRDLAAAIRKRMPNASAKDEK